MAKRNTVRLCIVQEIAQVWLPGRGPGHVGMRFVEGDCVCGDRNIKRSCIANEVRFGDHDNMKMAYGLEVM